MSQWNNNYNYGRGYQYRSYAGSGWKEWFMSLFMLTGVIGGIWLLTVLANWLNSLSERYTATEIWISAIALLMLAVAASVAAYSVFCGILRWWDGLWLWSPKTSQKSAQTAYNGTLPKNKTKPTVVNSFTYKNDGLRAGEREKPPSAEFFGRLEGAERITKGPMEEKYLNYWELKHWNKQKDADPTLNAASTNENDPNKPECVETTTKIDILA